MGKLSLITLPTMTLAGSKGTGIGLSGLAPDPSLSLHAMLPLSTK